LTLVSESSETSPEAIFRSRGRPAKNYTPQRRRISMHIRAITDKGFRKQLKKREKRIRACQKRY